MDHTLLDSSLTCRIIFGAGLFFIFPVQFCGKSFCWSVFNGVSRGPVWLWSDPKAPNVASMLPTRLVFFRGTVLPDLTRLAPPPPLLNVGLDLPVLVFNTTEYLRSDWTANWILQSDFKDILHVQILHS